MRPATQQRILATLELLFSCAKTPATETRVRATEATDSFTQGFAANSDPIRASGEAKRRLSPCSSGRGHRHHQQRKCGQE
jgi:hypothetical protein